MNWGPNGSGFALSSARIAEEFGLGKEKIAAAVLKEYDLCMAQGHYVHGGHGPSAVDIAQEFHLGKDKIIAAAVAGFEKEMSDGDYNSAAEIAKKYRLGSEKVKAAMTLVDALEK